MPPFYFEENDFARVPYSYNQDPQIIRLYSDQGGPRAQIGSKIVLKKFYQNSYRI